MSEAGDDVTGLATSFIVVQSLRFAISGNLPNAEGLEFGDIRFEHGPEQAFKLFYAGCAFILGFSTLKYRLSSTALDLSRHLIMLHAAFGVLRMTAYVGRLSTQSAHTQSLVGMARES